MKKIFLPVLLLLSAYYTSAQDIIYADVVKADVQRMNFEILGRIANNYLVYKEVKGKNRISVYDENLRLLEDVPLTNLPERQHMLDLSFFSKGSKANLVYQYQEDNVVYLMGARVEPNGRILEAAKVLDTTILSYKAENKIYNSVSSEDGRRMMLFKINRRDRSLYNFSMKLYDSDLNLVQADQFTVPMEDDTYRLGNYHLTNEGDFAFIKYNRLKSGNIANASLIEKTPGTDFKSYNLGSAIGMGEIFLDDIKLKVDEQNQRYILTSLYSNTAKGGMDGLYVSAFSKTNGQRLFEKTWLFDEDLRKRARNKSTALKSVFNDYFINNIVLHDDGSFTVSSEALYSTGGNAWNRWGYLGGAWGPGWGAWGPWGYGGYGHWGYWSPYRFYSPYFYRSYWWGSPGYYGGYSRYHADNIVVVSFDSDGNKTWDNVIVKHQEDAETDGSISYQILNSDGNMHFLLNNPGKTAALENIVINQGGSMREGNGMQAKDKHIDFMPRYAKQVGTNELLMPYRYKNNISFAKVRF